MATTSHFFVLLSVVAACGFPRPADVGDDHSPSDASVVDNANGPGDANSVDAQIDAPEQPGTVLHASPSGDDANDGLTKPVKTLKHAIGLAAANQEIRSIVLASGRYSTAAGETFPYAVPANVAIVGSAGGGAILAGTRTEIGMMVNAGTLQDLELEDFTVAVSVTGMVRLANLHIRTSGVGVRAETTAVLTMDNVDIAGTLAACAPGIVLNGAAELSVVTLTARNLGTTVDARDQSTVSIANANVVGDATCFQAVMAVATNRMFTLRDSLLDVGNRGITVLPGSSSVSVVIMNSTLRNMKITAIEGGPNAGGSITLRMTGGELSGNGRGGAELVGGAWTFNNVTIKQNVAFGIYSQDGTLAMRNCSVTRNGDGVYLLTPIATDLGTVVDPGNNTLQDNSNLNLNYDSSRIQVEAVGNTWNASVQGADAFGKYSPAILQGPIAAVSHNNYAISCDLGQCTLHR